MALQTTTALPYLFSSPKPNNKFFMLLSLPPHSQQTQANHNRIWMNTAASVPTHVHSSNFTRLYASKLYDQQEGDSDDDDDEPSSGNKDDPYFMGSQERREWRNTIRRVLDTNPDVEEELDPSERTKKVQQLLANYPLVVEEEDPEWPEDADGRGFKLDQFFDKIPIRKTLKYHVGSQEKKKRSRFTRTAVQRRVRGRQRKKYHRMEGREDLKSILEYLPVVVRSCSLFWPPQVVDALKVLAGGPDQSGVHSGELLFIAISDLRHSLSLSSHPFAPSAPHGYALFFDELMSREEARKWFGEVVPALANLLLRLPALLEYHYQNAGDLIHGVKTGLRLLDSQEAGIVLLSQELISALLGCSLFCLFPTNKRGARHLPTINFDHLFAMLYDSYSEQQENKIRCIIHYFERISFHMPEGFVSFERKVLPLEHDPLSISYPKASFWSKSDIPLCRFEVNSSGSGLIEDQSSGALEVDFANKYIGGGALRRGCVQEEIRFMINPELIASMLFMPSMEDNEAIEIIGAERFSDYTGYASSFHFAGDYVDTRDVDSLRRRKTRIIAIDALCSPGMRQYKQDFLLRETNKAFCGFFQQSKDQQNKRLFREDGCSGVQLHPDVKDSSDICSDNRLLQETSENSDEVFGGQSVNQQIRDSEMSSLDNEDDEVGIATGNWGCGAFGGDPEVKAIVQWLAASQAERPFILYYTFGLKALRNIEQVTRWIRSHEWTVGDLWNLVVEYSTQRLKGKTDDGFFTWLLPSLLAPHHDTDMLDLPISP